MKNKENKNSQPIQDITVDPKLDKFSGKVLFEDKVKAMQELLSQSPIPKEVKG